MKIALLLTLTCLISCVKKESGSSSKKVSSIQGTWELCSDSGGTAGDFKLTHVISGTGYEFTETYYASHDGSCTTAIVRTTGSHTIVKGSGTSVNFPEASLINVTFKGPRRVTALTNDADGLSKVTDCTGEASPTVGVTYDVTEDSCNWPILTNSAPTAGTIIYSIALVDTTKNPDTLSLGFGDGQFEDGTTAAKRHEYLENSEFIKQ